MAGSPSSDGQVPDQLFPPPEADDGGGAAVDAGFWMDRRFRVNVAAVVDILCPEHLVLGEVQDVGGHALSAGRWHMNVWICSLHPAYRQPWN